MRTKSAVTEGSAFYYDSYILFYSFVAEEKEGDCSGACVRAYDSSDAVDKHLAVKKREGGFNQIGDCARIFKAAGVADVALSAVIKAALCVFFHAFDDFADDLFLRADFFARDKLTACVHVHERADFEKCSEHSRGSGNASAAVIAGKVG